MEAGVKKSNLRQLAVDRLERSGMGCRCIRCREIGHSPSYSDRIPSEEEVSLKRTDYEASGGMETFLSYETHDGVGLVGFLRLRRPSETRTGVKDVALVRELKVFGPMVPIGSRSDREWQHRGYGKGLLAEAERIAFDDWGMSRLDVNAGIGVREYYRRAGYVLRGYYMSKINL